MSENIISNQINFDFFKLFSQIYKISITGPESCGKTSLADWLAHEFDMLLLPEYSREHMEAGHRVNNKEDILKLAKKQIASEQVMVSSARQSGLICDTDMLVLYIWCQERFPPVPSGLEAIVKHHRYDFTLLCSPDLPWVHDSLRENPQDRDRLFIKYKSMLDQLKVPYGIIKGKGQKRYDLAKKLLLPGLK